MTDHVLLGGAERTRTRERGFAPWTPRASTEQLLAQVDLVLAEYVDHLPLTLRQIFFRLVGAYAYEKTEQAYERLCEHLNRARRARRISMDVIRDDGGTVITPSSWASAEEFLETVKYQAGQFRLDRTLGQKSRLVVICEAAGMVPQLARVCDPFGITAMSGGGLLTVRAEPGVDAIRALRAWLKRGLRDFGLICLDVHEEGRRNEMTIDLNDTESQRSLVPPGVYQLKAAVILGGSGDDGVLKLAKNGCSLMLQLECTVTQGNHKGRIVRDYITVALDENGLAPAPQAEKLDKLRTSVRIGRNKVRAILDSAYGLDPNDTSETAQAKRRLQSYDDLNELVFWAQLEERPAGNGYGPSNNIDFIVVPGDPAYSTIPTQVSQRAVVPRKPLAQDLDDEIPY
jgi:hypothetical protein